MKLEHSPVQEEDDDAHNDQTSPNQQTKQVEQPPSIPGEDDELKVFGQDADGDQFITPLFEDKAELARENLVDGNQFDFELGDQQHFTPYTIGPFSAAPSQQQPCAAQFSPEQVPSEIMQETAQPQNNNNDPPQAEGAIVLPPYLPPVGMDGLRCPNPFPRMQLNGIAPGNVNYCLPPDSLFHDPANWSLLPPMDFLTGQPLLLAPRLISGEGVRLNGFNNHSLHPGGKLMAPPNLRFVLPRLQQQQQLYMLRPSNEARKWSPSRPGNPVVTNNQKDDSDKDDDDQEKRPHVKKPLNAFMIFMREERPKVIEDSELKESAAINQILGRKWHSLTKQQQSKYYDMAKEERENHMKLYPGWTARENYGLRRRRRKDPNRKLNVANLEQARKCRARYGSHRVDLWCRTCKRKKKCIRFPGNDDYEMMGILESPAIPGGSMIGRELLTGEDEEDFVEDDFNNECSMLKTRSPELLEIISSDDESEPEDEETITILHTKKQNPRVSSESNDSTEANDKDNDNKSHTSSAKENDSTSEKNVK